MKHRKQTQTVDEIERNPIGLPTLSAKGISGQLDVLVSSLSTQFHQYLKHHWLVEGPEHRDLHLFFEEAYEGTKENLDTIAERMTTLGAVPTSSLRGQAAKSMLEAEAEGAVPVRAMLKSDLENEQALIKFIGDTIRMCTELGDFGTETLLKQVLLAREERAHEIDHYLSNDSLVKSVFES